MLMDTGGNSGSQTSVTVIRSLSLHELSFSDVFRVVWKEFRVAFLCSITLALVYFLKLMLFDGTGIYVALVICITLIVTVFVAKLVDVFFPWRKENWLDPAVMASPFITTIVDAISLLIYFNIAGLVLHSITNKIPVHNIKHIRKTSRIHCNLLKIKLTKGGLFYHKNS